MTIQKNDVTDTFIPSTGTLSITGAGTFTSSLGVSGQSTLAGLTATNGTFTALTATGGINSTAIGATTASTGNFTTLGATGLATLSGGLTATNGSFSTGTFNSTLGIAGAGTFGSTLAVAGLATLSGGLISTNGSFSTGTFSTSLGVTALTASSGSFSTGTFNSTLGVAGQTTLAAMSATNGTFSGTLGVAGATTLGALIASSGSFSTGTFNSTLGVAGATTLAGLSATSGNFSSTLTVAATLNVTGGNVNISNNHGLSVSGIGFVQAPYFYAQPAGGNGGFIAQGTFGLQLWNASGVNRWNLTLSGTAETGSNLGGDFQIVSYNDASSTSNPLTIYRSNSLAVFANTIVTVTQPLTDNSTNVATTAFVTSWVASKENTVSGIATLDTTGRLLSSQIPAAFTGATVYQGTWDAYLNKPTLTSSTGTNGYYYKVSNAGTTTLNGISSWAIGDEAIFGGSVWSKILAQVEVFAVAGRYGYVTLSVTDIANAAPNASPTFTGTVTAPTGTFTANLGVLGNTTLVGMSATSGTFTSQLVSVTPATGDNSSNAATTGFVQNTVASYATKNTPSFTGAMSQSGVGNFYYAGGNIIVASGYLQSTQILSGSGTFTSTLGVTGAATLAGMSATTGSFSGTLGVTGATTLGALSASSGSFSTGTFNSTLGVAGQTTLAAVTATTGTFSGLSTFSSGLTATNGSFATGTFSTSLGVTALTVAGQTTLAGMSATTGTFTGATTYTSGTFSTTLGVGGATTLTSMAATTGTFSTSLGVTGTGTFTSSLGVSGSTTLAGVSATSGTFTTQLQMTASLPAADSTANVATTAWVTAKGYQAALGFTPLNQATASVTLSGDATGTATFSGNAVSVATTLASVGTAGTYGNAGSVAVITTDAKGRVTAVTPTAIAFPVTSVFGRTAAVTLLSSDVTGALGFTPLNQATASVTLSGDATGTATFSGNAVSVATTLASVGTAGTYGNAGSVAVITTDAKGRVTAVTPTAIAFPVTAVGGSTGAVLGGTFSATTAFTGQITAVTKANGDASANVATTQYVQNTVGSYALTSSLGTYATQTYVGTYVTGALIPYAPLANPSFTGTATYAAGVFTGKVTAITQPATDNTTNVATTAYVTTAVATSAGSYLPLSGGTLTGGLTVNNKIYGSGIYNTGLFAHGVKNVAMTTGQSYGLANAATQYETVILTAGATIGAYTVDLGSPAQSGVRVKIVSNVAITSLSVTATGYTLYGAAVTSMTIGNAVEFQSDQNGAFWIKL